MSKKTMPQKKNPSGRRAFTLVEVMIVIAIIGLIASIAIPNFIRARQESQGTMCTGWLERIGGAKIQVAFAENLREDETPTDEQLIEYLDDVGGSITAVDGSTDLCPAAGTYSVNDISTDPTCSLAGEPGEHRLK